MVRSDSILAQDNLPSFPETTSQEGEQPYDDESRLTKGQQRQLKSMRMAKRQPYPKKQQCDVEGYAEEETKEAPALHLQPQKAKAEEFESAEPAAAFFCGFESEGDAQTEEYIDFRRDASDCLHTTQMRTLTKDNAELEAEQSDDELATVAVKEQPCPEIEVEDVVEEVEVVDETEDEEEVEAPKKTEGEEEEKEVSGWAIPSATRIGGAVRSSHLRFAPEKPRRRGRFRLF